MFSSQPIAEVKLDGWADPAAGEKLRQVFLDAAKTLKHASRDTMADGVRGAADASAVALGQLQAYAMSMLNAALIYQGVGDTVRVELHQGSQDSIGFKVFGLAQSGEGETLFGQVDIDWTLPTATGGLTLGFKIHLTPTGSQPLWDFGDIVNAEATDSTNKDSN